MSHHNPNVVTGMLTFAGAERPFIAIKSDFLQGVVNDFTKAGRTWTNYPADTIEVILRHRGLISKDYHYHAFDVHSEAAIYVGMPEITGEGLPEGYEMLPADDAFLKKPTISLPNSEQRAIGSGDKENT